jgi:LytR cell envelope-related transcriptional attenuator
MDESWRKATIAVTVFAALEFVLLAGAGVALLGSPLTHHLKAEAAAAARPGVRTAPPTGPPRLARAQTAVIVLNGNGRTGAAGTAADRVRQRGYLVANVGNAARSDYTRTLVMYRRGYAAEGARLAHDLHVHLVTPLDGMRPGALMGAHLVLVVGT